MHSGTAALQSRLRCVRCATGKKKIRKEKKKKEKEEKKGKKRKKEAVLALKILQTKCKVMLQAEIKVQTFLHTRIKTWAGCCKLEGHHNARAGCNGLSVGKHWEQRNPLQRNEQDRENGSFLLPSSFSVA